MIVRYEKKCCLCNQIKPIGEFQVRKDSPDGRTYYCKICINQRKHEKYVHKERKKTTWDERVNLFWSKVRIGKRSECWLWTGGADGKGYGSFFDGERCIVASRFSYMITYGDVSKDLLVCHSCDNPPCVNPSHLFLGTGSDNMQDMIRKGRAHYPRGEDSHNAKLNRTDVREIRNLYATGNYTLAQIGNRFGIDFRYVSQLIHRQKWSWLDSDQIKEKQDANV